MRQFTASDIKDYEVEITEMDGHDAYGFIITAYSKADNTELTEEELDWLNDNGEVDNIIYEAGQDKMQSDGDRAYDEYKDSLMYSSKIK